MAPIANVLEFAEENRLKVQDFIAPQVKQDSCGVSVESPFINYTFISPDCRTQEGTSTEPREFTTPANTGSFNNNSGVYRELFNSANAGKTFTLLWKYEGWIEDIFLRSSSSGGLVQWSGLNDTQANALIGANIINIVRFIPVNPIPTRQFYAVNNDGVPTYSVFLDSRVSSGSFADVIYPQQYPYPADIRYVGTHARYPYRSTGKVLGWQMFNSPFGVRRYWQVKINIRADVSIGTGSFPTYNHDFTSSNPAGVPYPPVVQDVILMGFFKQAYSDLPYGEYPRVTSVNLTEPELLGDPVVPGFKKPVPPPPPPRRRCDCMTNCCPQNQVDLSEIKRHLRIIIAKQVEQDQKIGLDKLPLEVTGSNTLYQKLSKMAIDNPVTNFLFNNWLTQQALAAAGIFPNVRLNNLIEVFSFLSNESGGGGGDTTELEKILGEPEEVNLWDTDFNKPGSQIEKKKPANMFSHLKLITDRIETVLQVIGIHDLPITVNKSRSKYDKTASMFAASPAGAMVELAKDITGIDRVKITSLFQFVNWVESSIDEKLGHWESEVSFKDVDLLKGGDQALELVHSNMQHALHDITKFSGNAGIHSEANTWLISDVLMEMAVLKKEIMSQSYTMQALVDYLGFAHGEEAVEIPIPVTFDPKLLADKNLPKFLEDSTTNIQRIVVESKEKSLSQRLTQIEDTLGILRAVNLFPVRGVADIKALLDLLENKEKDWEVFINDMNRLSKEQELQLDLKTKKNDITE